MKIKEHWEYRLASLIMTIGLMTVLLTVGPLIDYHKKTSSYFDEMSPLLDRLDRWQTQHQPNPQITDAKLNEILREIRTSHFFNKPTMESSRISKYVSAQFYIGFFTLILGLYLAEKYKPATKEKSPDPEPPIPGILSPRQS